MKLRSISTPLFATIALVAAVLAAMSPHSAEAAVLVPSTIVLGSNNAGAGGFTTTNSAAGVWSTQTNALRWTAGSSVNLDNARALQEYTFAESGTYNVSLTNTVVNNGTGNTNRFGALLFATSNTSDTTGLSIALSYNNSVDANRTLTYRNGVNGTVVGTSAVFTGANQNDADGVTFRIFGTFAYVGTDINLSFQVTDGTTTSSAATHTVAASSFTGNFLGFGSRAEDSATFDYKSFSVVPEPTTFAMLLGGMGILLMRRRR